MECSSFVCFTFLLLMVGIPVLSTKCGCKVLSPCYDYMLYMLQEQDEAHCIADASIGTSTLTVFLKALQDFCSDYVTVDMQPDHVTYDTRNLYEVIIHDKYFVEEESDKNQAIPIIVIDAGQEAGTTSVGFALHLIEQLVGCEENAEMIQHVKWVIMPSTNPDGMEFSRYLKSGWKKNLNLAKDEVSFGVDISRNFDEHWDSCPNKDNNGFSLKFPGTNAGSELETVFVKSVLDKHKGDAKIYVSIRRDGHHIAYPFAYKSDEPSNKKQLEYIAAEVASKVNMRSGSMQIFVNDSIFNLEQKAHCGHSVDYAFAVGIPWCFEMRVFLETNNVIMSKFQTMPLGYQNSLRNGYMSGIRELYSVFTNKKKYGNLTKQ